MTTRRRIFLAHAGEDKPRVRKLYDDLEAKGFDPWLDEKDLRAGQIWKTEIPKAIREARLFLACLSSRSVDKVGFVQTEFREALVAYGERPAGSIYLIPVRLEDCEVPDLEIPNRGLSLRDFHWIDLWQDDGFDRLVSDLEHALGERVGGQPQPGTTLRDVDAPWCPELVTVPTGSFMMGSTERERRWAIGKGAKREWVHWEQPQHQVVIPEPFAIGKYQVTRGQFEAFIEATGHDMRGGAVIYTGKGWERSSLADWCSPGFEQTDQHPVVCVSWEDGKAYVTWLSEQTGQTYRLPSEAEWEYAARAGTTTCYWWGDDPPTPDQANLGMNLHRTIEVGSFSPNPWGLYDVHGNVWEWVEDCWNDSQTGAPSDGRAWTSSDCDRRVLRGGSWLSSPANLRSAHRTGYGPVSRYYIVGFRVARTLP